MVAIRRARLLALVPALVAGLLLVPDVSAGASLSIDGVTVKGDTAVVKGSASLDGGALVVDAGDSDHVRIGDRARLDGLVYGGEDPYTIAWSLDGAGDRFVDPAAASTELDTTGLSAGAITIDLTVTDAAGASATDSVRLSLYEPRILNVTADVAGGVPDEDLALVVGESTSGAVDGGTAEHPFTVPDRTDVLRLQLSWSDGSNDLDLYVDDPSDAEDDNDAGASIEMPEVVSVNDPAPGSWSAMVAQYLNGPDTYTLTADAIPSSPVPDVATDGPFRFEVGTPQVLTAAVTGGTDPVALAWDLDLDGTFESAGPEVTTAFGIGQHLVAVKATDAAGYEVREVTAVRVVEPGSAGGTTPLVVIGVSDSGINPYHRDFAASTYPDADVLALTNNFQRHPSEYIDGYPADARALRITLGEGYLPSRDEALFGSLPLDELVWIPGTKIIGAIDAGNSQPVNGEPDTIPLLDEDGHGTASASVAVGNLFGFCPTCLLVVGESFAADAFMYEQSWVDLASNSFGSAANAGFAGVFPPSHPREAAERGQIALYAAGNGNENAFLTPEQTYTSENLGPDWVVRVGAVERGTRKPIVGTGKPVDVASFGAGTIPSAAHDSVDGVHNHSGTSSATPYTAGVFGTVLRAVRGQLGDASVGAKGDGVLAQGSPVAASAALGDGALTRAELTEAIFKTAEHDEGGDTAIYPPTTPALFPAQYLVEGYGIVEPESGARALEVLMGTRPLPERPDEDEFFALDEAIRDALWGDWSGAAGGGEAPESAADIVTLADALAVLAEMAVDDGPTRFYPRLDDCGTETPEIPDNHRLEPVDGPDGGTGCGFVPGASVIGKVIELRQDYPLVASALPLTLLGGTAEGVVYVQGEGPSLATLRMELSTTVGATPTVLGSQSVDGVVTGLPDEITAFPFSFSVPDGLSVDDLTFSVVWEEAQGGVFISLDGEDSTSYIDIPVATSADPDPVPLPDGPLVQVQVVPVGAEPTDGGWVDATWRRACGRPDREKDRCGADDASAGRWSARLDLAGLPAGAYAVFARLIDGGEVVAAAGPAALTKGT